MWRPLVVETLGQLPSLPSPKFGPGSHLNRSREMCYPGYGIMHIKDPLLLIGMSSMRSEGRGLPLSLSLWPLTKYQTPNNRKNKMC